MLSIDVLPVAEASRIIEDRTPFDAQRIVAGIHAANDEYMQFLGVRLPHKERRRGDVFIYRDADLSPLLKKARVAFTAYGVPQVVMQTDCARTRDLLTPALIGENHLIPAFFLQSLVGRVMKLWQPPVSLAWDEVPKAIAGAGIKSGLFSLWSNDGGSGKGWMPPQKLDLAAWLLEAYLPAPALPQRRDRPLLSAPAR